MQGTSHHSGKIQMISSSVYNINIQTIGQYAVRGSPWVRIVPETRPVHHNILHQKEILTRRSFPRRSSVLSAPNRGNASSARTLSNNAADNPSSGRPGTPVPITAPAPTPPPAPVHLLDTPCPFWSGSVRVVTPPLALLVMSGTALIRASATVATCCACPCAAAAARLDRGMYGVYVVWRPAAG